MASILCEQSWPLLSLSGIVPNQASIINEVGLGL